MKWLKNVNRKAIIDHLVNALIDLAVGVILILISKEIG